MSTRLIPLGTNGYIPSFGRQTMSFLVLTDDQALLLDAGTGVGRLAEHKVKELLRAYDHLDILLSHYHLDHIVGLSYLPGTWTGGPVTIYGPEQPLVYADAHETIDGLLRPPLFSLNLGEFPTPVRIVPVTAGPLRVGALRVRLRPQEHPGGSAGIRIGDTIAYVTDTVVDAGTQDFVCGVALLMHDTWLTDDEADTDPMERSGHSYAGGVASIAREAAVGRLMPVHHHPTRSRRDLDSLSRYMEEVAGLPVVVPDEAEVYELD